MPPGIHERDSFRLDDALKPVTLWMPDTHRPGFAAECRRQSQLCQQSAQDQEMMDWIEQAADLSDWQ